MFTGRYKISLELHFCLISRYLDKLMGTTFFHESHFQGLLERVRERGRVNVAQRVADQVSRLFNQPEESNVSERLCNQTEDKKEPETPLTSPAQQFVYMKLPGMFNFLFI